MKVFIDTNIFLDFLLNRKEFESAKDILFLEEFKLITSDKVLLDIFYFWKKEWLEKDILNFISEISNIAIISGWTNKTFLNILDKDKLFSDFEDNFQDEIANEMEVDFIITNNKKDFKNSKIKTFTSKEFLSFYFN